jgi:alkanesulfonate monooxygenase SsuD/methylene tetrahydromethanopterin reductase-like flavin-dependent oxidoreductase (luciferase family)
MTDDQVNADEVVKAVVIAGSAKTVAEKILAYREKVGPFGHMLLSAMDWDGPNRAIEKRSMELLAQEVMPRVNRALEGKA